MNYRIGIIDDEDGKVTQVISHLVEGFNEKEMLERYKDVSFIPIQIDIQNEICDTVSKIIDFNIQGIIIDYKLSSQQVVSYSGVDIAKELMQYNQHFPIFILTSFEEDLFDHEIFNAYQVFDFGRYQSEAKEQDELHSKLVQQIISVQKMIEIWETELIELLPQKGQSASIDDRILDLDSKLEHSIASKHAFSTKLKKDLSTSNISKLLEKLDKLIGEE